MCSASISAMICSMLLRTSETSTWREEHTRIVQPYLRRLVRCHALVGSTSSCQCPCSANSLKYAPGITGIGAIEGVETMSRTLVPWHHGDWTTEPVSAVLDGTVLIVEAAEGSDFWEKTLYGFQHANGHALLAAWPAGSAVEVSFSLNGFTELYDQAGLMLWNGLANWIKAGVEMNDGVPHLASVVTDGYSDWSLTPVPEWMGQIVTIRASQLNDAVILRAHVADEPWRTMRVAPFGSLTGSRSALAQAGPYVCAPTRPGFRVTFTDWVYVDADTDLHNDPPSP